MRDLEVGDGSSAGRLRIGDSTGHAEIPGTIGSLSPMSPTPLLNYGSAPRPQPQRIVWRTVTAVGLIAISLWGLMRGVQRLYYSDRDRVHAALQDIPGATVAVVAVYEDGPGPLRVPAATVYIDGSPHRSISLDWPRARDLRRGTSICIYQIGGYGVNVDAGGHVTSLDIGRDGELAAILPFKVDSVADLARHYDQILRYVKSCPCGTYAAPDGTVRPYRIWVERW